MVFGVGSDDAAYVDEPMPSGAWTGWVGLGGNVVDYQSIRKLWDRYFQQLVGGTES